MGKLEGCIDTRIVKKMRFSSLNRINFRQLLIDKLPRLDSFSRTRDLEKVSGEFMTSSQSKRSFIYPLKHPFKPRLQRSRVGILALASFCGVLVLHARESFEGFRWMAAFSSAAVFFQSLVAPEIHHWLPLIILLAIVSAIVRILSPEDRNARSLVVAIFLALTLRYVLWRLLYTLNLSNSIEIFISISFLLIELFVIATQSTRLFLTIEEKNRHREADRMSEAILDGSFQPSIDIFIPTYNEPAVILRRTIIGCQSINYTRKSIYVLDDTRRSEIADLAKELGCEYITRPDNRHAKAGNLNHAMVQTHGDLIVVFDADFIPTQNFIERTAGFFQNKFVGLVQTHQCFYNSDIIARNLGLEEALPHEFEMFYRQYQLMRDGARSVLCCGSAFIVRRSALEEVGGFFTESLCEDYYTSVCLSARGYEVIYLDENLSAGLIAESIPAYLSQRQRWARGTLQGLFLSVNPLTIPGLNLRQRLCHIEGVVQWFANLIRIVFLVMPVAYYFFGIFPLKTSLDEWLYFFLPYYLISFIIFSWLNRRSLSIFVAEIYAIVQSFPVSITVIQTLFKPFSRSFKVTPKGIFKKGYNFHYRIAAPLTIVAIATALGLIFNVLQIEIFPSFMSGASAFGDGVVVNSLGNFWAFYNLFLISLAILSCIDVPQASPYLDFKLKYGIRVKTPKGDWLGVTQSLSEVGATVILDASSLPSHVSIDSFASIPIQLEVMEENLVIPARIEALKLEKERRILTLEFEPLSLDRERHLIELLFCRPGRWDRQESPGEWRSAWLLIQALLKPKFTR